MAILIDTPRWWFQGRRWSHLVSDVSLDELHAFADDFGIPRRGFQGDHYDVPEEYLSAVIDAGAELVDSRVLVRRLKSAGLRLSPADRRGYRSVSDGAAAAGSPVEGTPATGTPGDGAVSR